VLCCIWGILSSFNNEFMSAALGLEWDDKEVLRVESESS
jgi:hypothetical protein